MWFTVLAALQAAATPAPRAQASAQPDVVVIGRRANEGLAACLARGCPPEEEVEAAMNAATESFSAGEYKRARTTLYDAVGRNRRYAARMPIRVANLYATYADVLQHEGEDGLYRSATIESVEVLRRHLGRASPAAIAAAPRIGDMMVRMGELDAADRAFRDDAETAAGVGNAQLVGMLNIRRTLLAVQRGRFPEAERLLADLERTNGADPLFAEPLRVMRTRLAIARDPGGRRADDLIAALAQASGGGRRRQALLYAPPYPAFDPAAESNVDLSGGFEPRDQFSSGIYGRHDIRWADIGFWVMPDGRTEGAETLRRSSGDDWTGPLRGQIGGRRYAPVAAPAGSPGAYKVERFTLRPSYEAPLGTRMRMRAGTSRLHVIDVTQLAARRAGADPATP